MIYIVCRPSSYFNPPTDATFITKRAYSSLLRRTSMALPPRDINERTSPFLHGVSGHISQPQYSRSVTSFIGHTNFGSRHAANFSERTDNFCLFLAVIGAPNESSTLRRSAYPRPSFQLQRPSIRLDLPPQGYP